MKIFFFYLSLVFISISFLYDSGISAERRVLIEMFTNTSCGPCYYDNTAWDIILDRYRDELSFALIRTHMWWPSNQDPFYVANKTDPAYFKDYYNFNAVPVNFLNGQTEIQRNFSSIDEMVVGFKRVVELAQKKNSILNISGSFYPKTISNFNTPVLDDSVLYEVKVQLKPDSPVGGNLVLKIAVIESNIAWDAPNGLKVHNQVLRKMVGGPQGIKIDLSNGLILVKRDTFRVSNKWELSNLEVIAWVQDSTTKEVFNCEYLSSKYGFVTNYEGLKTRFALIDTTNYFGPISLTNTGIEEDIFTVEPVKVDMPDSWQVDFCDNKGCYFGPKDYKLKPGQSVDLTFGIIADSTEAIGVGKLEITSNSLPSLKRGRLFTVINDYSPVLYLTSNSTNAQSRIENDLDYFSYDIDEYGTADPEDLKRFTAIFYNEGGNQNNSLDEKEISFLKEIMENNGNILINSKGMILSSALELALDEYSLNQDIFEQPLFEQGSFVYDYLHIEEALLTGFTFSSRGYEYDSDNAVDEIRGVKNHFISKSFFAGMKIYTSENSQRSSCLSYIVKPAPDAATMFYATNEDYKAPLNATAITFNGDYKLAFFPVPLDAIRRESDRQPLIKRIIDWLLGIIPVEHPVLSLDPVFSLLSFNPVGRNVTIKLDLPSPEVVKLKVFDINGKVIKTIANNNFSAGSYTFIWNANDNSNSIVPDGIYFIKAQAGKTSWHTKIILIK